MTNVPAPETVEAQHGGRLFLAVWVWLFVLSACSWLVAYFGVVGYPRWTLLLVFMLAKAVLIVTVFMRLAWERAALIFAIVAPLVALIGLISILNFEATYTFAERMQFFGK